MNGFGLCSRCGRVALEHLRTHSHCWECNYSPEYDASLSEWHSIEYRSPKPGSHEKRERLFWLAPNHMTGVGFGGIV